MIPKNGGHPQGQCDAAKVPAGRLGMRDAVASLEDITAMWSAHAEERDRGGNPFRFTNDNIDQFNF
jgi:hypothetical protein